MRRFALSNIGSPLIFIFFTLQGTLVSYLQVQLLKYDIFFKIEPIMRSGKYVIQINETPFASDETRLSNEDVPA